MIHQDGSVLRLHTDKKPQDDQTSGFRPHTLDTAIHTLDVDVGTAPVSSTSFLLSQLRCVGYLFSHQFFWLDF